MVYKEAAAYLMPFGKHKGRTLHDIALADKGLGYLKWLQNERRQNTSRTDVDTALAAFLNDPKTQRDDEA